MDEVLTLRDAWFHDILKHNSGGPYPVDYDTLQKSQHTRCALIFLSPLITVLPEEYEPLFQTNAGADAELNIQRIGGIQGTCNHGGTGAQSTSRREMRTLPSGSNVATQVVHVLRQWCWHDDNPAKGGTSQQEEMPGQK